MILFFRQKLDRIIINKKKFMNRNPTQAQRQQQNGKHPARTRLEYRVFNNSCFIQEETSRYNFHNIFTEAQRRIYLEMGLMAQCVPVLFPSHEYIAWRAQCHPSTVKRAITVFKNLGMMAVTKWTEWSNIYHLPNIFNEYFSRKSLITLLNAYKYLSLFLLLSKPALAEDGLLLNIKCIYKHEIDTDEVVLRRTSVPQYTKKERPEMAEAVSQAILNIKSIKLTTAGQYELSRFTDEAIKHADDSFKYNTHIKEPFKLFFGMAKKHSESNNLPVDWRKANDLLKADNIPLTEPRYTEVLKREVRSVANKAQPTPYPSFKTQATFSNESDEFIRLKAAEFDVDTSYWLEWRIKDHLEEKGYSRTQLQQDYEIWMADKRKHEKELYGTMPQKELIEACLQKLMGGFIRKIE